jgi:hypothetical protein
MSDLDLMALLPDVSSALMGDLSGGHLESVRESDPEAVAAVVGFIGTTLGDLGEQLGLGPLRSVSVAAASRARVILLRSHTILSATVEPGRALGAVEKALEGLD